MSWIKISETKTINADKYFQIYTYDGGSSEFPEYGIIFKSETSSCKDEYLRCAKEENRDRIFKQILIKINSTQPIT